MILQHSILKDSKNQARRTRLAFSSSYEGEKISDLSCIPHIVNIMKLKTFRSPSFQQVSIEEGIRPRKNKIKRRSTRNGGNAP